MRRTPPLARILPVIALLALLLPSQTALADAEHNAALRYWRGMALMSPELEEAVKAVDFFLLEDPDWAPDDELRKVLQSEAAVTVHEFTKGAALPECDFGLDRQEGFEMLLPHLGGLRTITKLLLIDGRMRLTDGDATGAAERFATAYALAAHCAEDELMISSLVSMSMAAMCERAIMHELTMEQLGPDARRAVSVATFRFGEDDPFHLKRAIEAEGKAAEQSLRQALAPPVTEANIWNKIGGVVDLGTDLKEFVEAANNPDAELARMRLWYMNVDKVWDSPDALDQLKAMEAELDAEDQPYGLFTLFFAPSVTRSKANDLKAIEMLEKARTMLAQ